MTYLEKVLVPLPRNLHDLAKVTRHFDTIVAMSKITGPVSIVSLDFKPLEWRVQALLLNTVDYESSPFAHAVFRIPGDVRQPVIFESSVTTVSYSPMKSSVEKPSVYKGLVEMDRGFWYFT